MALTTKQLQSYNDQGFLVVENLLPTSTVDKMRERIQHHVRLAEAKDQPEAGSPDYEGGAGTATKREVRKLTGVAEADPFMKGVLTSDAVLDITAELAGSAESIYLFNDQAFLKPAFCGSEKPLHQDNSYFRVTPFEFGLTCWIAIDDANEENGCLRYIPGSHKLGLIKHRHIKNTPHQVPLNQEALGEPVPAPVPSGGAVFHHLLTCHESKANRSPQSRWAWALHMVNGAITGGTKNIDQMLRVR